MNFLRFDGPDMAKLAALAKQFPKGMHCNDIMPGALVMMSPNKGTGDRSWTDEVWTVIEKCGPYFALRPLKPDSWRGAKPILVSVVEHEFYDAQEVAAAMAAEAQ